MKIIECPRDAMQGMADFVPTEKKAAYINQLLKVGFDTVDFGSFVSPKAIPQMKDTAEVLSKLDLSTTSTKLLAIIANIRGANDAVQHEEIAYLGFPFSISETFQKRNTNQSILEALNLVNEIQELCVKSGKNLITYISMGFGNPYGDPYDLEIVEKFTSILVSLGVNTIALADTVGVAEPMAIGKLYQHLSLTYPNVEFGAHLHADPMTAIDKVAAAYDAGCRRFDGAIRGFGGCPMAKDDLVGNIPTEGMISYFMKDGVKLGIDQGAFEESLTQSKDIFIEH